MSNPLPINSSVIGCRNPAPRAAAFSLVEILVAVALLSFIILGLLAMFHQTQRAFRSSITQTDVLEAGRAFTEMLAREIEQMAPSHAPYTLNFFAEISGGFTQPLVQNLPGMGTTARRTNVVQRFFLLSELNRQWTGTGYQVLPPSPETGVGTLYRFTATASRPGGNVLSSNFQFFSQIAYQRSIQGIPMTNLLGVDRVLDGVVHLRLKAYATNGFLVGVLGNGVDSDCGFQSDPRSLYFPVRHTYGLRNTVYDPMQTAIYFRSNAVPAYLELELGILEPRTYERFKALGTPAAQRQFLEERSAQVHLFRQRIPVRNVDYKAYR